MENSARQDRQRAAKLCKMPKNPNPKVEVSRQKTEKEREDREVVGWG